MKHLFLLLIFLLAIFFRFNHLNWDENFHLHPDERFLTMVVQAMKPPLSFDEYFHQKKSLLNPPNIGFNFYVYGTFPLVLTKYLAVNFGMDNYNEITILGRFLSALVDFLTVILVYKTAKILSKEILKPVWRQARQAHPPNRRVKDDTIERVSLFSAFFYAISVYPIQSAHFFTTDTFLNFFIFGSFYFILKNLEVDRFLYLIFSSLFFSLALASKISALYILPLNLAVLFLMVIFKKGSFVKKIVRYLLLVASYLLFSYLFLRIFDPYYFENLSFFDFSLNKNFVNSIKSLDSFSNPEVWYPPGVQWINKPWYGLLLTTFLVGLGPINFIVMMVGILTLCHSLPSDSEGELRPGIYKILKYDFIDSRLRGNDKSELKTDKKKWDDNKRRKLQLKIKNFIIFLIILWVLGYFIYQSSQFVRSIRYTIYLYPFFAIFGGVGINMITNLIKKNLFINYVTRYTLYVILLLWPLLFSTIYFHPHTRILASEWIYKNLESGSVILGEHWDDPLPLPMEKNFGKFFQVELLPVFDPDTPEKWQKIKELLQKADYYVLSSNRGWGSIPTVSFRYPLMSQYYQALLNNDCEKQKKITGVCFKKIKTFEPYYYQFIKYPDNWVEETFTVYDHPTVIVLKKFDI
jgi:hypothetical protein